VCDGCGCSPMRRSADLPGVVATDHDELDRLSRSLVTVDVRAPAWRSSLDSLRVAFAAHAEAHSRAMQCGIVPRITTGPLARVIARFEDEHRDQERLIEALAADREPAELTILALDLRAELLAHAFDERLLLSTYLQELLATGELEELGALYMVERSRSLELLFSVVPADRGQLLRRSRTTTVA
jgi:hypothetical protein